MINTKKILERELNELLFFSASFQNEMILKVGQEIKKKRKLRGYPIYTKEYLIKILQQLAQKLGRNPTENDLKKELYLPSFGTFIYHFRTWNKALEAAGLFIEHKHYTNDELIKILQKLTQKLGRIPIDKDIRELNVPSINTYKTHFGTLDNALREAGLKE